MQFSTKVIHVGQEPEKITGAIIPPIYMTSTYVQETPGKDRGYDYTRAGNPNFSNLEHALSALEEGKYATVFSSGLGAITALFAGLIALGQFDIKKVLAYSTISQLGFMFVAMGVGAYAAGIFHLMTHAFFKGLLFLGAGSVMQNYRKLLVFLMPFFVTEGSLWRWPRLKKVPWHLQRLL